MDSIALRDAFHFSLQATHCETGPGGIAVRSVAPEVDPVNGGNHVPPIPAARVSLNPPHTPDVSRREGETRRRNPGTGWRHLQL